MAGLFKCNLREFGSEPPSPLPKRKRRHDKNVNLFLLLGRFAWTMRLIVVGFYGR